MIVNNLKYNNYLYMIIHKWHKFLYLIKLISVLLTLIFCFFYAFRKKKTFKYLLKKKVNLFLKYKIIYSNIHGEFIICFHSTFLYFKMV